MALQAKYFDLIWQRHKTHEFRRRFLRDRAARWFVYLNAPVSKLAAVIDLGPAEVGSPDEIAAIAEQMRPGNEASVLEYVRDLDQAYAVPILSVTEYPGLPVEKLRADLGAFHPPQGYVRLARHPGLLALCEKMTAEVPIRSITVHHRLYRLPVSVDGADWGGMWHASVLAPALAQLGIPPREWPVSVFTPLITDHTGGKLSKTLYVARGTYSDLPEAFLNLDVLLARHGDQVLDVIWSETIRWAEEPRRLHRGYTITYLTSLLSQALAAGQLRAA